MQIKMSCYHTAVFVTRILFVKFVYLKKLKKNAPV